MSYISICNVGAVGEGGMGFFRAGKKTVLLLWPRGGELAAYRGRCPHADVPLDEATFDGQTLLCNHHSWGFDGASGRCVTHIVRNTLHRYPLLVQDDEILVDVGPPRPARNAA